ncbi:hypothetical protein QMK30_36235 [Streptomyces sp. H27-C3]|nr:hypothetical protein [Streptomyces sp. H27-C3]MDJ0466804.1 hypothetical protein [Streptomyces sp. H27-C3]
MSTSNHHYLGHRASGGHHGNRCYGKATAQAWDRLHPRLTRRAAWLGYAAELPIISGTVIRLEVEHLLSGGAPKPRPETTPAEAV